MLAAASIPVNAITAIGSANARSDQLGAVPRWMLAVRLCASNTSTNPSTMISACTIRSPIVINRRVRMRRALTPVRLSTATSAITARATAISSAPRPIGPQNAAR